MNERARVERQLLRHRRRYGAPGAAYGPVVHMPVSGYDLYLASLYINGQVLSVPGPVRDADGGATAAAVLGIFGRLPFEALQGVMLR